MLTAEQQVTTKQRFMLLDGNDLKELGFLMGPRKQLLQWIQTESEPSSSMAPLLSPSDCTVELTVDTSPSTPRCSTPSRQSSSFLRQPLISGSKVRKFQVHVTLSYLYAVYTLVNGIIAHQKQQILKKCDIMQHKFA